MHRLHMAVHGAVQGVGFRYFVRRAARSLDLAGYVINRADGSVELEASGPPAALETLRRTVEGGPPIADVQHVQEMDPTSEALPHPFEIRH